MTLTVETEKSVGGSRRWKEKWSGVDAVLKSGYFIYVSKANHSTPQLWSIKNYFWPLQHVIHSFTVGQFCLLFSPSSIYTVPYVHGTNGICLRLFPD